jgi:deoxyribonuclease IV
MTPGLKFIGFSIILTCIMRRLGVHTSIAGGLPLSLERAHALGCSTMQIFSHNPRGWAVAPLSQEEISRFRLLRTQFDISPVYIHTSYLINMASRDAALRKKSIELLSVELDRADAIGADYVILHTGSASGDDGRIARQRAVSALREVASEKGRKAGLPLENTAGRRGDISSLLPEMSEIMNAEPAPFIAGVCIDTCHAFASGYDIRTGAGIRRMSDELIKYIGIDKVKLIHLNDSKGGVGSHLDRHEHIGCGKIGAKGLRLFMNHPLLRTVPLILETPKKKESDDPGNISKVRKMIKAQ